MAEKSEKSAGTKKEEAGVLTYKGRPLIRSGNTVYYGSMSEKYIVMLQIEDSVTENGLEKAAKVGVFLQQTAQKVRPKDRVIRRTEKKGLYEALDVGAVWLERALAEKM